MRSRYNPNPNPNPNPNANANANTLTRKPIQVLDDLHGAVSRVKSMAGQMHEELASQNRMIGALMSLVRVTRLG